MNDPTRSDMEHPRHREVLRTAQHFGPDEWPHGALVRGETAEHWGERSCGIACLRSVVHFHTGVAPDLYELLCRGLARGAFGDRGWIHASLADLSRSYGLAGASVGMDGLPVLYDQIDQGLPVIVSCSLGFPDDGRRGGHLVLATGRSASLRGDVVHVVDPSRRGRVQDTVPATRLAASWTGRAIVFRKAVAG